MKKILEKKKRLRLSHSAPDRQPASKSQIHWERRRQIAYVHFTCPSFCRWRADKMPQSTPSRPQQQRCCAVMDADENVNSLQRWEDVQAYSTVQELLLLRFLPAWAWINVPRCWLACSYEHFVLSWPHCNAAGWGWTAILYLWPRISYRRTIEGTLPKDFERGVGGGGEAGGLRRLNENTTVYLFTAEALVWEDEEENRRS